MDTIQDTKLPNTADREALKLLVPTLVEACPDMYEMACAIARDILASHDLAHLDPEQVYFHRFHSAQSSPRTFTGWEHRLETPRLSMTLPQLVIQRFSVHDQDNADLLDSDAGFYTAGPDAENYDESNEIRLHANDVLKAFWEINFADRYQKKIKSFWNKHGKTFRALAKCTFLAKAMEDRESGRLSDENFRTAVKAVAGNVSWPVTRQMLEDEIPPAAGIRVSLLKIGGFVATDILCIVDAQGKKMIYVPGEAWGVHALQSDRHVHWWVLSKIRKPDDRKRFMSHFQVADHDIMEDNAWRQSAKKAWLDALFPGATLASLFFREPHVENVGLNHILDLLVSTWDSNDHKLVESTAEALTGDAFTFLASATHARMLSDATFMMHTNGDLRKKLWVGYLNAFNRMFGPMAAVGWPVALVVVGAGIANVGLQIDQAVNGKTPQARKSAVTAAIFTAIDTLFNATFLKGEGALPEIAETSMVIEEEEHLVGTAQTRTPLPPLEDIAPKQVLPAAPEDFLESFKTTITEPTLVDPEHPKFQEILQTPSGKRYIYMRRAGRDGFYEVRYVEQMRSWVIIDPAHPYSFYRNVPVRLNEALKWEPAARPGLKGGMKIFGEWPWGHTSSPLPELPERPLPYDVAQASATELRPVAENRLNDFPLDSVEHSDSLYQDFKTLRRSLYDDAIDFYSAPSVPPRPMVPALKPSTSFGDMSKRLLKETPGLVLGQENATTGARQLLINNFKVLNKQKVRTLYLDQLLTDFHQTELDVFHRTGKMPASLEESLKAIDIRLGTDPTGPHSYLELVKAAQKNHIRVQAIDCMVSRRFPTMEHTTQASSRKMLNYFSDTAIRADQAAHGDNRWVALIDEERASTFEGVPGISEQQGVIAIRVEELPTGKAGGVSLDPGKKVRDLLDRTIDLIKSDLRLQLDASPTITARNIEEALPRGGMFMIEESTTLIHRSGDGTLVRTPIQHDAGGFFIVRPRWSSVSGRHFDSVHELATALEHEGLSLRRVRIDPKAGEPSVVEPASSATATRTTADPESVMPDKALFDSPYEIPPPLRGELRQSAVTSDDRTLGDQFISLDEDTGVKTFQSLRQKLNQDATRFYAELELPPPREVPPVDPAADPEAFIDWWINHYDGLVLGESHGEVGSKRWLIENMPEFSRRGMHTLYMEHLMTDFHQVSLNNYYRTGVMPRDLELYLKSLDRGHMTDPMGRYTFLELVKTARNRGIRIQAIDCMASYRLTGMKNLQRTSRQKMMNYYAHTVIEADQVAHGPQKWIALMGNSHANTYEGAIGVSETEGALGLRIEDVPQGEASGYQPDPGRTFAYEDGKPTGVVKSDLRLQMETPWASRSFGDIEKLLSRPGMFTLTKEPGGTSLLHRGRDNLIVKTHINYESGRYFIERPAWPTVHQKRFDSMQALIDALNGRGLTLAGWSGAL